MSLSRASRSPIPQQSGDQNTFQIDEVISNLKIALTNPEKITIAYPDGSTYTGQKKEGVPHGFGAFYNRENKSYIIGSFCSGKANGLGIYEASNNNRYVGEFKKGRIPKNGIILRANGEVELISHNVTDSGYVQSSRPSPDLPIIEFLQCLPKKLNNLFRS